MKRLVRGLLVFVLMVIGGSAFAQSITYTFSGNIDGSVGGTPFTAQNFTFVVNGNLGTVQNTTYPYTNPLTSGTITIAGTACAGGCSLTTPGAYAVFNTGPSNSNVHGVSTIGNPFVAGQTLLEACYQCGPIVNDNLASPISPTASGEANALAPYMSFPTSGGAVIISFINGGALTYAVVAPTASIPTLSEWGMIILAMLLLVSTLFIRRRNQ